MLKMLKSRVWGPYYWFVLMTMAVSYPMKPNEITKKKYYEYIHNLPLFMPNDKIGSKFEKLLDKYPVTPYLDSREMFTRWVQFIHNRVNIVLGKPSMSYADAMAAYYDLYKEPVVVENHFKKWKKIYIYLATLVFLLTISYFFYE